MGPATRNSLWILIILTALFLFVVTGFTLIAGVGVPLQAAAILLIAGVLLVVAAILLWRTAPRQTGNV